MAVRAVRKVTVALGRDERDRRAQNGANQSDGLRAVSNNQVSCDEPVVCEKNGNISNETKATRRNCSGKKQSREEIGRRRNCSKKP